ncbi:coiled-coil domain-containing protein 93 isoform X2 [Tachyglossus aculeatus]|uniref:coiled-coil domain-containing protein 93 isoform X2 n=1 Tax=Tachyglossus aculeatus TaxID=9261 RepID=UPI0018F48177|nr:coiled-coil domain-containing protein 93 isoform X2 [Tachyglossus aculeatus]
MRELGPAPRRTQGSLGSGSGFDPDRPNRTEPMGAPKGSEGAAAQEAESREDEEQSVKLTEILELLVAAGYFRARIKGLTPFDKVVGGLTWCISTCSYDVDVDLLFQENSTIGQKIALTEKLVSVLPRMQCPHRLEPHQIQGLDFIHIFPVVQWLVKRAIESREESGDYVRSFSVTQFQKTHCLPEDVDYLLRRDKAVKTVSAVLDIYKPLRRYRRPGGAAELHDQDARVRATLLEYGRRYGFRRPDGAPKAEERQVGPAAPGSGVRPAESRPEEELQAAEEGPVTAGALGHIVGQQVLEIRHAASKYASQASASGEGAVGAAQQQQHSRLVASLNKQIAHKTRLLDQLQAQRATLQADCDSAKRMLAEVQSHRNQLDAELDTLQEAESQADPGTLQQLRALVAVNDGLKNQEQEFRAHCREEMSRLKQNIESLKAGAAEGGEDEEPARRIGRQYQAEKDKLQKIRLLLARRNREIAILQRKIDEVPCRAELSQYQKRFIELYGQVLATHKETKQFFTLYNTLDDKKVCLEKEVNLLNSIHDNFKQAMASPGTRDQFLRQLDQIVDGIKQNRIKMEKQKQENKMRRDELNDEHLGLLDKQRLYFKTVKDFKEECRKNEALLSRVKAQRL